MNELFTFSFLIVSVILFSFAVVQLISKDKSLISKILSLLFFAIGYICLYYWMYRFGILAAATRLVYSDVAVTFLFGPILYFYVRSLKVDKPKYSLRDLFQYLPAVMVFIFLFIYNPGKSAVNIGGGNNPNYRENMIVFVLNSAADFTFFTYTLISAFAVRRITKNRTLVTGRPLRCLQRMLVVSLLTYILFFLGHLKRNDSLLSTAVLINGINCAIYLFSTSMYPEYTQKIISELKSGNKKEGRISGLDHSNIEDELNNLFLNDRIYLEPDLSVQTLSFRLGIKNHQLTHVLNKKMNTNFRNFINQHRVEAAKRLLLNDPSLPILDIAFSVGFNSKSSFNNTFQKFTMLTPTEYRKNNQIIVQNLKT